MTEPIRPVDSRREGEPMPYPELFEWAVREMRRQAEARRQRVEEEQAA